MMKITRIKKRIICLILAVSILLCGVTTQYRKAEAVAIAIPGIAELASLVSPWGSVFALVLMFIGPILGATISIPVSEDEDYDYFEEFRKFGEGAWKDFKHYYLNEWIRVANEHYDDIANDEEKLQEYYYQAEIALLDFKEYAEQGCIDTTSQVWDALLDYVDMMVTKETQVPSSSVSLNMGDYGLLAEEGMSTYVNDYVAMKNEVWSLSKLESLSDVNIAFFANTEYYDSSRSRYSVGVILYSLASFSATLAMQNVKYGNTSNRYFSPTEVYENTKFYVESGGSMWLDSNEYKELLENIDHAIPSASVFDSYADFLMWLNTYNNVITADPDPTYVLPAPGEWVWEKSDEAVKPEDVPDVIVLAPDAVAEHAENNDAANAELERLIELALAQEIPWSQVFEYLNIDYADVAPVEPGNPSTDVPDEKPSDDSSTVKPSTDIPYSYSGLENIFPFCIPFDIYKFLNLMDAKAEAPSFKWTFVVYKKKYNLEIDLKKWDDVASVLRAMELIAFCVGLAMITRSKLIRS